MSYHNLLQKLVTMTLTVLVLVGCGTTVAPPSAVPPTVTNTAIPLAASPIPLTNTPSRIPPTTTPLPTLSPLLIEVMYDGSNCIVSGPTELPIGDHQFILTNLTEVRREIWMNIILDENKSIVDMRELQGEPGKMLPGADWIFDPVGYGGVLPQWKLPDGREVFTNRLDREAEYVISVGSFQPLEWWICSSVYVSDSP